MDIIMSVLEQGLIFSIVALGVYITFKILDFPDMSVDGTFPLGASVCAKCLLSGMNPFIACFAAFAVGCVGGLVTGILNVKLKISGLLSGILVMTGLYSINLRIMGKSNIPLFNNKTIFSGNFIPIIYILIFAAAAKILLDLYLSTKAGFILRAAGDNEQLVTCLSVDKDKVKITGLMLSNGLAAMAGAIMAQYQKFSDAGMGTGTVVMGLAAVVIGESIFKNLKFIKSTSTAILGSIIYKAAVALTLSIGLAPTDLKLITAVIVTISLCLNNKKSHSKKLKKIFEGGVVVASDSKSL